MAVVDVPILYIFGLSYSGCHISQIFALWFIREFSAASLLLLLLLLLL